MAGFKVTVPHSLGRQTAQDRVAQFLDSVRQRYAADISNVRGDWQDNLLEFGFTAVGMPISGTLVVEEQQVQVSGPLPLMAMMFRGKVEQTIRGELERLLA
jgi:hypothetical protein